VSAVSSAVSFLFYPAEPLFADGCNYLYHRLRVFISKLEVLALEMFFAQDCWPEIGSVRHQPSIPVIAPYMITHTARPYRPRRVVSTRASLVDPFSGRSLSPARRLSQCHSSPRPDRSCSEACPYRDSHSRRPDPPAPVLRAESRRLLPPLSENSILAPFFPYVAILSQPWPSSPSFEFGSLLRLRDEVHLLCGWRLSGHYYEWFPSLEIGRSCVHRRLDSELST